jgi:hypothetical protein
MHIREIGTPTTDAYNGIVDLPVQGWPGIPSVGQTTPSYGDWFTKWLAQSAGNLPEDPLNNADNYALFMLANYVQTKKGWYPSKRQVPISPTSQRGYSISSNDTAVDVNTVYGDSPYDFDGYCYSHGDDIHGTATNGTSAGNGTATCSVPAGCTNEAAPTGCAVACS